MDIARIQQIICKQLRVNIFHITGSVLLVDNLGMDSLDLVQLTMEFEEEYDIDIPDKIAMDWKTVDDIISYLAMRLRNR